MSRAEIGIEPGPLDEVQVVPVAEDYWHALVILKGRDARVTLQICRDDLHKIETACRKAQAIEAQRRAKADTEAAAFEDARSMANDVLARFGRGAA